MSRDKFSPARMLLTGRNSANHGPNFAYRRSLAVPGVRIHLSPPSSLRFEAFSRKYRKDARVGAARTPHRHRREPKCRVMPRHFDFLSVGWKFGADAPRRGGRRTGILAQPLDKEWYLETCNIVRNFSFSTDVVLQHAFPHRVHFLAEVRSLLKSFSLRLQAFRTPCSSNPSC
jgi:hypothetical protein